MVASLYVLATIVAPARATATLPTRSQSPAAAKLAATLSSPPKWKPAAAVLHRKGETLQSSLTPWMSDSIPNAPRTSLSRWHRIYTYSTKYGITVELARKIYDAALREKLEPELAFRLVNVESQFKTRALSSAGAIGLTQLMLGTARGFEPNITREALHDEEMNLRIGFRYLRSLIRENNNNLLIALLVYNRGPVAVQAALNQGLNPTNGYDRIVTKGYRGKGFLE